MIAAHYVLSDGALRFSGEPPVTDATLVALEDGALACAELPVAANRSALDDAQVWRGEAELATRNGDARLALRCWRVVRQFQPEALDVLFQIGCCHALLGDRAQASQVFDALAHIPDAPVGLRRRAGRLMLLVDPITD